MFQKYRKNFFSQNGEDGVISEILKRLNLKSKEKWCCEFGAWDGIHGSNTFNLVKNYSEFCSLNQMNLLIFATRYFNNEP